MPPGPEIRANWTRIVLDRYETRFPPVARQAVAEAVTEEQRARLSDAGPLGWLPADLHMRVLAAPFGVMKEDTYRLLWRRTMSENYELPLFRSFVQGAVAMFKHLPAQVFRVIPQGFGLIARACGEFSVDIRPGQREVEVSWAGIPNLLLRDESFIVAWAGTLESILDLTSTRGTVTIDRRRTGYVLYRVTL
jgi:hypothetical protein